MRSPLGDTTSPPPTWGMSPTRPGGMKSPSRVSVSKTMDDSFFGPSPNSLAPVIRGSKSPTPRLARDKIWTKGKLLQICSWIDTLGIRDPIHPKDFFEQSRSGHLLNELLMFLQPGLKISGLHRKVNTKALACSNYEKALQVLWGKSPRAQNMPTADELYEGGVAILRVFWEVFHVYVIRPIERNVVKDLLLWYDGILRHYGRGVSSSSFSTDDSGMTASQGRVKWTDFRSCVSLACVMHFFGKTKPDMLLLFWEPESLSELKNNVEYTFELYASNGVPVYFTVDEWCSCNETDFLTFQLQIIYDMCKSECVIDIFLNRQQELTQKIAKPVADGHANADFSKLMFRDDERQREYKSIRDAAEERKKRAIEDLIAKDEALRRAELERLHKEEQQRMLREQEEAEERKRRRQEEKEIQAKIEARRKKEAIVRQAQVDTQMTESLREELEQEWKAKRGDKTFRERQEKEDQEKEERWQAVKNEIEQERRRQRSEVEDHERRLAMQRRIELSKEGGTLSADKERLKFLEKANMEEEGRLMKFEEDLMIAFMQSQMNAKMRTKKPWQPRPNSKNPARRFTLVPDSKRRKSGFFPPPPVGRVAGRGRGGRRASGRGRASPGGRRKSSVYHDRHSPQRHRRFVHVDIKQAKNLRPAQGRGTANPYIQLELGPYHQETMVKKSTLSPVWNEELEILWPHLCDNILTALVKDQNPRGADKVLGLVRIELSKFQMGESQELWLMVEPPLEGVDGFEGDPTGQLGQIQLIATTMDPLGIAGGDNEEDEDYDETYEDWPDEGDEQCFGDEFLRHRFVSTDVPPGVHRGLYNLHLNRLDEEALRRELGGRRTIFDDLTEKHILEEPIVLDYDREGEFGLRNYMRDPWEEEIRRPLKMGGGYAPTSPDSIRYNTTYRHNEQSQLGPAASFGPLSFSSKQDDSHSREQDDERDRMERDREERMWRDRQERERAERERLETSAPPPLSQRRSFVKATSEEEGPLSVPRLAPTSSRNNLSAAPRHDQPPPSLLASSPIRAPTQPLPAVPPPQEPMKSSDLEAPPTREAAKPFTASPSPISSAPAPSSLSREGTGSNLAAMKKPRRKIPTKCQVRVLSAGTLSEKCDPYVVCQLGQEKQSTSVIKATASPKWDEVFAFPIRRQDSPVMTFNIIDKDRFTRDDAMGTARLDLTKVKVNTPTDIALDVSLRKPGKDPAGCKLLVSVECIAEDESGEPRGPPPQEESATPSAPPAALAAKSQSSQNLRDAQAPPQRVNLSATEQQQRPQGPTPHQLQQEKLRQQQQQQQQQQHQQQRLQQEYAQPQQPPPSSSAPPPNARVPPSQQQQSQSGGRSKLNLTTALIRLKEVHLDSGFDFRGKADPYVVLELGSSKRQSSVKKQTLTAIFDEIFELPIVRSESSVLTASVFDKDLGKDDLMGINKLDLAKTGAVNKLVGMTLPLMGKRGKAVGKMTVEVMILTAEKEEQGKLIFHAPAHSRPRPPPQQSQSSEPQQQQRQQQSYPEPLNAAKSMSDLSKMRSSSLQQSAVPPGVLKPSSTAPNVFNERREPSREFPSSQQLTSDMDEVERNLRQVAAETQQSSSRATIAKKFESKADMQHQVRELQRQRLGEAQQQDQGQEMKDSQAPSNSFLREKEQQIEQQILGYLKEPRTLLLKQDKVLRDFVFQVEEVTPGKYVLKWTKATCWAAKPTGQLDMKDVQAVMPVNADPNALQVKLSNAEAVEKAGGAKLLEIMCSSPEERKRLCHGYTLLQIKTQVRSLRSLTADGQPPQIGGGQR